jgi:hypothetical protein
MRNTLIAATLLLAAGCTANAPVATAPAESPAPAATTPAPAALAIVESPIAANCFTAEQGKRTIDTVVIHHASAIYWFSDDFQKIVGESGRARAAELGLTPENLPQHKYDWQLVKSIFEAYKVSAHYIIARDGTVVRLVADNDRAWHAGRSRMPTDGREGVNAFSIGIELMSSHPNDDPSVKTHADAYTEPQYAALQQLIARLAAEHPITAVVGHDEIAPGRKTDPGPLFQWERVRTPDFKPLIP